VLPAAAVVCCSATTLAVAADAAARAPSSCIFDMTCFAARSSMREVLFRFRLVGARRLDLRVERRALAGRLAHRSLSLTAGIPGSS
jgi:hypothetical protein